MRVQVDETGCDDEVAHVHLGVAADRALRDRDDRLAPNTDIADRIEPGLRVHDAPSQRHDVVAILREGRRCKRRRKTGRQ